jgi:hypothetical protein
MEGRTETSRIRVTREEELGKLEAERKGVKRRGGKEAVESGLDVAAGGSGSAEGEGRREE